MNNCIKYWKSIKYHNIYSVAPFLFWCWVWLSRVLLARIPPWTAPTITWHPALMSTSMERKPWKQGRRSIRKSVKIIISISYLSIVILKNRNCQAFIPQWTAWLRRRRSPSTNIRCFSKGKSMSSRLTTPTWWWARPISTSRIMCRHRESSVTSSPRTRMGIA